MKRALVVLSLAALLAGGLGFSGCATGGKCCGDAAAKCADCGCPDSKAAGAMCDKCKAEMMKDCPDCKDGKPRAECGKEMKK